MKIEDIDREFRELARSLQEAQHAFRAGNFAQAEPLYRRALELTERSYGEDHSDTALCLQNLADTYYSLRKYKEAVPLLRRLQIIKEKQHGVAHPEVATVLFKLAKTYEKLGMPNESDSIYRRALRVAEQVYGKESSYVATVLEGFANMLRRAQIRLPEAVQMEERLRDIREVLGNSSRTTSGFTTQQLATSIQPGSAESAELAKHAQNSGKITDTSRLRSLKSASEREKRPDQLPADSGSGPPRTLLVSVCILLGIIGCGLIVFFVQPTVPTNSSWNIGDLFHAGQIGGGQGTAGSFTNGRELVFRSANGREQVRVLNDKDAVIDLNGSVLKGTYTNAPDLIAVTPEQQSTQYTFHKGPYRLIDSKGIVLYAMDSPEMLIIRRMVALAKLANSYYRKFGQYPSKSDRLLSTSQAVVYLNPFTHRECVPIGRSIGKEEDSMDMNLNDFAAMQNTMRQLTVWSPERTSPGIIEFYRCAAGPDGDTFYIRGTDGDGLLFKGTNPGTAFVIVCAQGSARAD